MYQYANVLFRDEENKKDEAIKYFKMAADNGDLQVINDYGNFLLHYLGNKEEAFKYFIKASEEGHIE